MLNFPLWGTNKKEQRLGSYIQKKLHGNAWGPFGRLMMFGGLLGSGYWMWNKFCSNIYAQNHNPMPTAQYELIKPMSMNDYKIIAGSSNRQLAGEIASYLNTQLGRASIRTNQKGESEVKIWESLRGNDVYLVQSLSPPIHDNLMELLLMSSAAKRSGCRKVTAIIPYMAYTRMNKKESKPNLTPLSCGVIAKMLDIMAIDSVITIDCHTPQISGYYRGQTPVINLDASYLAVKYFKHKLQKGQLDKNFTIVSPDQAGLGRITRLQEKFKAEGMDSGISVLVEKADVPRSYRQTLPSFMIELTPMAMDVSGKDCILINDMVDTGNRTKAAVMQLKRLGAKKIFVFMTHGLFSGKCLQELERSPIEQIVITNTINMREDSYMVQQLSVGPFIGRIVKNIREKQKIPDRTLAIFDKRKREKHEDEIASSVIQTDSAKLDSPEI